MEHQRILKELLRYCWTVIVLLKSSMRRELFGTSFCFFRCSQPTLQLDVQNVSEVWYRLRSGKLNVSATFYLWRCVSSTIQHIHNNVWYTSVFLSNSLLYLQQSHAQIFSATVETNFETTFICTKIKTTNLKPYVTERSDHFCAVVLLPCVQRHYFLILNQYYPGVMQHANAKTSWLFWVRFLQLPCRSSRLTI